MPDMRLSVIGGISADAGARHDFRPHHAAPIAVYLEGRDRTPCRHPFEGSHKRFVCVPMKKLL